MTTRAGIFEFLLAGVESGTTGEPVSGGTVYFYEAGTTTPKYVWTEIEKTNGYYSYALDTTGAAQLYGEGNYKCIVKDAAGAQVGDPHDNVRVEFPYYGIRTVTTGTTAMVSQDDFIRCNTSGGNIHIDCLAAASWTRPLKVKRTAGTGTITIDPNGSETIDGASTLTLSSDAVVEIISDGSNLESVGFRSTVLDNDGDTGMVLDETLDEDIVRFDVGGTQDVLRLYASGAHTVYVSGGLSVVSGNITQSASSAFTGGTVNPTTLQQGGVQAVTTTGVQTLTNKTLTGGTVNPTTLQKGGVNVPTISEVATLTNKTLTSPTINTPTLTGGTVNPTTLQQGGVQALTASNSVTVSGKNFSQDGTITITDNGNTANESPLVLITPNIGSTDYCLLQLGKAVSVYNIGYLSWYHSSDGSAANWIGLGMGGVEFGILRVDGSQNVGIGKTSSGAKLDVDGEIEGSSLDINGNSDVSGTAAFPGTLNANGTFQIGGTTVSATASEINTACDGITATAAEINGVCDGTHTMSDTQTTSSVTIPSSLGTLETIDLGTVATGDLFFITATVAAGGKGGTGGTVLIQTAKDSGTSSLTTGASSVATSAYFEAAAGVAMAVSGMFHVSSGGTLVVKLEGSSAGSTCTGMTVRMSAFPLKLG